MRFHDQQITVRVSSTLLHRIEKVLQGGKQSRASFVKKSVTEYLNYLEDLSKRQDSFYDRRADQKSDSVLLRS